jgi:hypothetical protein
MPRTSVETTADGGYGDLNGKEETHGVKNSLVFLVDSMDPDDMDG